MILEGFEALAAQNILIKAELEGLKQAISLLKKKQVRSKNIFDKILEEDGTRAIYFSPSKIRRARELEKERLDELEAEEQGKVNKANQRKLVKEEKEAKEERRRVERKKAQEIRAAVAAQKRAEIDARKLRREEKRRQSEIAKAISKNPKKKASQSQIRKMVVVDVDSSEEPESSKSATTRAGRKTRPRRHFDETYSRAKL